MEITSRSERMNDICIYTLRKFPMILFPRGIISPDLRLRYIFNVVALGSKIRIIDFTIILPYPELG